LQTFGLRTIDLRYTDNKRGRFLKAKPKFWWHRCQPGLNPLCHPSPQRRAEHVSRQWMELIVSVMFAAWVARSLIQKLFIKTCSRIYKLQPQGRCDLRYDYLPQGKLMRPDERIRQQPRLTNCNLWKHGQVQFTDDERSLEHRAGNGQRWR